ncbi:MAG: NADP oxidoreductase [Planctomycetota bacterium]
MPPLAIGGESRPLRVAVIGSGPSAFYAAEAVLKAPNLHIRVDMFERLPVPFGLVRFGVAPDHQNIKAVTRVYDKIAADPRLRYHGNVAFGKDLSVGDLRRHFDAVVFAVGSPTDRKLGVPGEDLAGGYPATSFVAWYNSHPDFANEKFDLSCGRACVVGIGNVAMDVTRILVRDPDDLAKTDIADYAVAALKAGRVKEVLLLGRRGPVQSAFSPREIQEIGELSGVDIVVDPRDLELDPASEEELKTDPKARQIVDYLRKKAAEGEGKNEKKVRLKYLSSPVELLGGNGRISAIRIERNTLVRDDTGGIKAKGSGTVETVPVGAVFRSVGYQGVPLPGVPFDAKKGVIANDAGRVVDAATRAPVAGMYVAGWIKRGPTGLIGTNKADSIATVENLLKDAAGKTAEASSDKAPEAVTALLASRKVRVVSFAEWKTLDKAELDAGKAKGKVRDKFFRVPDMLAALGAGAAAKG